MAPTAMKSTPVRGHGSGRGQGQPAARLELRTTLQRGHDLGHRREAHVVQQHVGRARRDHGLGLLGRRDLDLDPQVGEHRPHPLVRRHDAARGDDVVVLDQRRVGQRHPVVDPAADPDGVLLQHPQPGRRLAGVADARAGPVERVDPRPGGGRDARGEGQQVQRDALGREQRARAAVDADQHVAGLDPVPLVGEDLDHERARRPDHAGQHDGERRTRPPAGRPPRPGRRATNSARGHRVGAMVATEVTSTPSPAPVRAARRGRRGPRPAPRRRSRRERRRRARPRRRTPRPAPGR